MVPQSLQLGIRHHRPFSIWINFADMNESLTLSNLSLNLTPTKWEAARELNGILKRLAFLFYFIVKLVNLQNWLIMVV